MDNQLKTNYQHMINLDFEKNLENFDINAEIVLIGDSQIELFKQSLIYKQLKEKLKITFLSARAADTFDIVKALNSSNVKFTQKMIVFILIGTNDLAYETEFEQICQNYQKIKQIIMAKNNPNLKVISVLNVNDSFNESEQLYLLSKRTKNKIARLNDYLIANFSYIEVNRLISDAKSNLSAKFTNDGLHLNEDGYKVLIREIIKYV